MTTTKHSSTDDLLKIFDSFSIQREEIFTELDLKFCEQQQELLYQTLDGIRRWYDVFREEADKFAESHVLTYEADGSLTFREQYREQSNVPPDYTKFDFKPFEVINRLVDNRKDAINAFTGNIIRYFNNKYNVSVPIPVRDEYIPLNYRPLYTVYTVCIENHLQGRGFRITAENEIVNRFHALIHPYRSSNPPQLKNDKIIFHRPLSIVESYHASQPAYRIDYSHEIKLDILCEGILFGSKTLLNGNSGIIQDFNYRNVDINRWYSLTFATGYAIKFYKNGRIDVRFPDAEKAKNCFERLHLNDLENSNNE